jgi:hypothetical protein
MKPQLIEDIDKARDTVTEVDQIVSSRDYPCDTRTVMVRGLLSTMIEHHRSLLQLVKSAAVGSSLALAREIIKGLRYGLWIQKSFGLAIGTLIQGLDWPTTTRKSAM